MDKVLGWFWKGKTNDITKNGQTATSGERDVQSTDQAKTDHISKTDTSRENSNNNNVPVTEVINIKPVLVADKPVPVSESITQFLQKHTYLKPEDCLLCKLTATGCATLLFISGINLISHQRKAFILNKMLTDNRRTTILFQYGIVTAIYAVILQKEWYNALTKPPGDAPRTFLNSLEKDFEFLNPQNGKQNPADNEN